ncbi:histidine kinase [Pseudomonas versuta]|uniref:histidine kinase n=1 Tax=Pseudomonas versuta TaxID=1788301 RepID=A0A853ZZD7_9PSED|nr:GAF domain-containing sensor histidine kinase [Pseudomonas versuta]OKA23947.1 histidine kinase [Pseudomonas versuta]
MGRSTAADIATIDRISAVPAILQVITEMTGMRFAAVARVTQQTWTACAVLDNLGFGLQAGGELDLVSTLCFETMTSHLPIVIDQASTDPLYQSHHTPKMYRFESYITIPVFRTDGAFFGTLCALDPEPASLKDSPIQSTMESFARLLSLQIEAEENLQRTEIELIKERENAELREQFIAVIGHDLRNPLFAITTAAERILRKHPDPQTDGLVQHILSCGNRASQLVEDVLDFARGRLGSGIPLTLRKCSDLDQVLRHVISEVQSVHPHRQIQSTIETFEHIECDSGRLAQLLSNLLANAITHGSATDPVRVDALCINGVFTLSVTNQGPPIPADVIPNLFQPYSRPASDTPQAGLGLGLYIASQIALSHGGQVDVVSNEQQGTVFTFRFASQPGH